MEPTDKPPIRVQNLNLRPFVKGQSGNPHGRPRITEDQARLRKLTKDQISEMGSLILEGNLERLKEISKDPESSVLQVWMSAIAVKSINKGDMTALNGLLDRLVGKVKEEVHIDVAPAEPHSLHHLTMEELETYKKLIAKIETDNASLD